MKELFLLRRTSKETRLKLDNFEQKIFDSLFAFVGFFACRLASTTIMNLIG